MIFQTSEGVPGMLGGRQDSGGVADASGFPTVLFNYAPEEPSWQCTGAKSQRVAPAIPQMDPARIEVSGTSRKQSPGLRFDQ